MQVHSIILALDHAAMTLSVWVIAPLFMIGALLYFTHVARRLGREMMTGSVIFAILVYAIFPSLINWSP